MANKGKMGMRNEEHTPSVGPMPGHTMLKCNKCVMGGISEIGEEDNCIATENGATDGYSRVWSMGYSNSNLLQRIIFEALNIIAVPTKFVVILCFDHQIVNLINHILIQMKNMVSRISLFYFFDL